MATSYKILTAFLVPVFVSQMCVVIAFAGGIAERQRPTLAPLFYERLPSSIDNEYIIVFKPGTPRNVVQAVQTRAKRLGGIIKHEYRVVLNGFSCTLSKSAVQALRAESSVRSISSALKGSSEAVQDLDSPPPNPRPNWPANNWPKGIDRTSERGISPAPRLNGKYTYSESGSGVHVYVVDTGILATHTEFGGRVSGGINTATVPYTGITTDCSVNSHGTHMAGTIGGETVGIAKNVELHPVRATDCNAPPDYRDYIAAIEWVTNDVRTKGYGGKAVVNFSNGWDVVITDLNNAVINSMNAIDPATSKRLDIMYVIAAGNRNADACTWSPSSINVLSGVPKPIVVGAVNPMNDTRWVDPGNPQVASNTGTCLNLFAPGANIVSAGKANTTDYRELSGTSSAAAHVTGVVARILSRNPPLSSTDSQSVWNALHVANNHAGTSGWTGVSDAGPNSPNEMLHYGSLSNGQNDGDPHITTVNEIHYDFQPGGEFVALRDANGMEIQTRQTPVPGAEYVSINTAIAARVGKHRVTWQPHLSGQPDPAGLQLRVDGELVTIGANGHDLEDGGRMTMLNDKRTLEINFPDGTTLFVTANWWGDRSLWYLTVQVFHTPATEGIMGNVEQDSWKNPEFAETWRVTDKTSLFDYAPGLSTKMYSVPRFPLENTPPVMPEYEILAKRECEGITTKDLRQDCLFDVGVTGDRIFAKSARIQELIQHGATSTTVIGHRNSTRIGEKATFTATVVRHERGDLIPTGGVMFLLDGKPVGKPARLDSNGQARWTTRHIVIGKHHVAARYIPEKDSVFLSSFSIGRSHTVKKREVR